eukprot:SM000007S20876  [mRNA]  locus=s7:725400:726428:+ [translate_table: standard]
MMAKLTPLGQALDVARRLDAIEREVQSLAGSATEAGRLDAVGERERARLTEAVTEMQLRMDGIEGDEAVRPVRRAQTQRMHALIQRLEALASAETIKADSTDGALPAAQDAP